ncbi:GNAT family N-acetyltransferase [Myxococcota bacterium]|nr:GNAT family N-acetyltransferase [Myxococcota bacterium]
MQEVVFAIEPDLSLEAFVDILHRSTLALRRPVADRELIAGMLRHADLIVTARLDGQLIGVSRAISDFSYCTYLSDLAVDQAHQGKGIGRVLIRKTHEAAGLHTSLILIAAPKAETYYPHIGMRPHPSCWVADRQPRLPVGVGDSEVGSDGVEGRKAER